MNRGILRLITFALTFVATAMVFAQDAKEEAVASLKDGGGPTIYVTRWSSGLIGVEFTGTLQSAPSLTGPWTDVASLTGAWPTDLAGKSRAFFSIGGAIIQSGVYTDIAINGEGFFMVRDVQSGELFATRSGEFRTDSNGFLITNGGLRVQGFSDLMPPGQVEYRDTAPAGDIRIDIPDNGWLFTMAEIANVVIGGDGKLQIILSDGVYFIRGQILLQNFSNPDALLKVGSNLYSNVGGASALVPAVGTNPTNGKTTVGGRANTHGLGGIEAGALNQTGALFFRAR